MAAALAVASIYKIHTHATHTYTLTTTHTWPQNVYMCAYIFSRYLA